MKNIKLLDCTLRDGGYINNWQFGEHAIRDIKNKLEQSGVDIIELGFLRDDAPDADRTVFNSMDAVKKLIGQKQAGKLYAVMAEVSNPFPLEKLAPYDEKSPEVIRVIVWKRMLKEGFEYCKGIVEKGYKLCVQPARVSQYSDAEFVDKYLASRVVAGKQSKYYNLSVLINASKYDLASANETIDYLVSRRCEAYISSQEEITIGGTGYYSYIITMYVAGGA